MISNKLLIKIEIGVKDGACGQKNHLLRACHKGISNSLPIPKVVNSVSVDAED